MAMSVSLLQWCSVELGKLLSSETSDEFTRYLLAIEKDQELQDYLSQLLNNSDPTHSAFIKELMQRRNDGRSMMPQNFTVYHKPSSAVEQQGWKDSGKHRKSKSKEKKSATTQENAPKSHQKQATVIPVENSILQDQEHALAQYQGARCKTKYVALYSQEGQERTAIQLPGRNTCDCQAHKHSLVSNCLECGRVVCSQEGSGPCLFCGALVCNKEEQEILARNSKKSEKLRKRLMCEVQTPVKGDSLTSKSYPKCTEGINKAIAHKDKLIEFDRTSIRRTPVVDDQSDYFCHDTNQWLSSQEKDELRQREDQLREQHHVSRQGQKFMLDFAGRKVVEEEVAAIQLYNRKDEVVQSVMFGNKLGEWSRMLDETILDPTITRHAPKFVGIAHRITDNPLLEKRAEARANQRVQDRELMEMSDEGHCLSMHQPWASLLVIGIKRHEGRTWYSPHRGPLWIAAAAKLPDQTEIEATQSAFRKIHGADVEFPKHYPTGCLLGCVDMVDCLAQDDYREKYPKGESSSEFVFICENPRELLIKFAVKGRHKIWRLDTRIHRAAKQGLQQIQPNS